jgi:IclR family acetate operon transcriptional repressor
MAGQVQSLSRGLVLLETVAEIEDGVTLSDLAMQVGLAPSTTHRLLNTLELRGFLQHDAELGRWHIGVRAFHIGNAFLNGRDFVAQSRPFLVRLMEQSGETANLGVEDEGEAVMLAQVQCREMMRMMVPLGSRSPMHASGIGKALLATMSEAQVTAILHRRGLTAITEHSVRSPEALRKELEQTRARGWAYDDEEHAIGLRCVAATLHDELGQAVAGISLSGPRSRIPDERVPSLGQLVADIAAEATRTLGGRPPAPANARKAAG